MKTKVNLTRKEFHELYVATEKKSAKVQVTKATLHTLLMDHSRLLSVLVDCNVDIEGEC